MGNPERESIGIKNEKGILEKHGAGFHSPMEYAEKNLFYVVWSDRYVCSSLYSVKRDFLPYYSVICVMEGGMELVYEGKTTLVKEGEAVFLDFRKPHEFRTAGARLDKWEMVFDGNASGAFYDLITGQWGYRFLVTGRVKETIRHLMSELAAPVPRDHRISLLIHSMFSGIMDQKATKLSPPIEEALAFMYANYTRQLKISEVADHVLLSRHYFSRLFQKETGRTPNESLADIRINAAKEKLAEEDVSVTEIAELCGFVNTSHFVRFFREKTGQTPAAFRRSFRL